MTAGYKQQKEAFVSGTTGSSITHINLISLVALASVTLYATIRTRLPPTHKPAFLTSWALLVLPLLLSMTLLANHPILLSTLLLLPTLFILLRIPRHESIPLPSNQPPHTSSETLRPGPGRIPPLPALTTYRAHMMLMTILAILSVDFPIFPRELAKCETWGTSLMDLGVGSFVFSQGIVSAIPLLQNPYYISAPFLPKLTQVTKKSLPIILLGLLRVLLVKGTEYPEHISEYGVHWNFFLTLALLPILQVTLHPVLARYSIAWIGLSLALLHQVNLTYFNLQPYILNAPRTSLLSKNKEGLGSLLGYLSIHLLGLSTGTLILAPSPSFFRRRQRLLPKLNRDTPPTPTTPTTQMDVSTPRQLGKSATELCAYAILWWVGVGAVCVGGRFFGLGGGQGQGGVSRRMANLVYILWVAAFNTSFLLAYLLILDIGLFPFPSHTVGHVPTRSHNLDVRRGEGDVGGSRLAMDMDMEMEDRRGGGAGGRVKGLGTGRVKMDNPPRLLEVLNRRGLGVFLGANLLTGLVNISMRTMYASTLTSFFVLSGYSIVVCWAAWVL